MHILIIGGTGAIGQRLVPYLLAQGDTITVLSRRALRPAAWPRTVNMVVWDGQTARGWGQWVEQAEAIINLAGAGVADAPWTKARKALIISSRVQAAAAVAEAMQAAKQKPRVLIQASAIGYYGTDETRTMIESSPSGDDFLAEVCRAWEAGAAPVAALGVRVVTIRTGVVLDPLGGALPKMTLPIKFFVGGPLGSGRQWLSWIHYADEVAAIRFLITQEALSGAFNLTAPNPVHNAELTQLLGQMMHRPTFMPAPSFALKLILGELSEVVLKGQRVLPERLQSAGYVFQYNEARLALQNLLAKNEGVIPNC